VGEHPRGGGVMGAGLVRVGGAGLVRVGGVGLTIDGVCLANGRKAA
jgi:hypothetical protein